MGRKDGEIERRRDKGIEDLRTCGAKRLVNTKLICWSWEIASLPDGSVAKQSPLTFRKA